MAWTPASGSRDLISVEGHGPAIEKLTRLLLGEVAGSDLCHEPWRSVLIAIGVTPSA